MQTEPFLYALAAVLVIVGLLGTILPALPGIPLVFAGLLLAAWVDGFVHVGPLTLALLALLTVLSFLVDFWATAMGAKRVGASRKALAGAVIGTFVGIFFGIPGIFVGPFAGAMAGELLHRRRLDAPALGEATRVGLGTWIGVAVAVALKLMLAFAMIGVFALAWWAGR
ncbi:DUF456 domain-containing protein [Luteimonas huabeiensis]|uniref:DUF456 domain-containing protein n=1 Tax=Luteimonas huabeiensis TaxID=1244513 RepID=UPI000466C27B|nr:DUF456 domain-containing protein [Luteimonas huabeiensis]